MRPRFRAVLACMTLALSGCAALPARSTAQVTPLPAGRGMPFSFAPLVKRVAPAVVNIAVTETTDRVAGQIPPELRGTPFEKQFRDRMRNRRESVQGAGSGFIIDASGTIVTNNHVVGHADRIVVSLADGTELPARLVGTDDLTDIAVIKVTSPSSLPFVSWGDSRTTEVGDWILAAGNPFGLTSSVTAGIVSARGREIGAGPFDDFIQIDAPINPGNSGGPTFNMDGQVIGVNTAIVSPTGGSVGIGFAVPSEIAARIVADLQAKGRIDRGWLGVSVQDGPVAGTAAAIAGRAGGVTIAAIDRSGPGARAGLRPGDVVTAVNGDRVDSARGLIKAVAATAPGNQVKLSVRRGAQNMEVPVTVGRRPPDPS
jgi:serine protease Do